MASYALLRALSGFEFDLVRNRIGFNPLVVTDGNFRCFWSLGTGWGTFEMQQNSVTIHVQYGSIKIKTLNLPFLSSREVKEVSVGKSRVKFEKHDGEISFSKPILIERGQKLTVRF